MRRLLLVAATTVVCSIFVLGCSREDKSPETGQDAGTAKQAVLKPLKQKIQPPETRATEEPAKKPEPSVQVPTSQQQEQAQTPSGTQQEQPQKPPVAQQEQAQPQEKEKRESHPPKTVARSSSSRVAPKAVSKLAGDTYQVEPGDTLAKVAAKKEVFGDPLKWAILYRLNAAALESVSQDENLPDAPLPAGVKLGIPGTEEMKEKIDQRTGCMWVVNVLSATTKREVVPAVVSLIRKDYPVYVVSARVNEKDYMRVRVGFFKTMEQAQAEARKIKEMLSLKDSWVTRMPMGEFAEFAGY